MEIQTLKQVSLPLLPSLTALSTVTSLLGYLKGDMYFSQNHPDNPLRVLFGCGGFLGVIL